MGGESKMKILALEPNRIKFCIHNLGAHRELEMQKPTTQNGGGVENENDKPLNLPEPNFVQLNCGIRE